MIPDIGTRVVYGTSGVCTVVDMREEDFGAGKRIYYVLRPLAKHSVSTDIFVPADNERLLAKIKNVLTPKEIYELIEIIPEEHMDWIDDNRARSIKFESVISEGDRHELVALTKATYNRKHELSKQGKKLSITDERFIQSRSNAEKRRCQKRRIENFLYRESSESIMFSELFYSGNLAQFVPNVLTCVVIRRCDVSTVSVV